MASKLAAEFVGTFTLVAIGVGTVLSTGGSDLVAVALAHGFAIAIGVTAIAHVSGAHLNPAVSLALLACRLIGPVEAGLYVAAQVVAGIVATLVVMLGFGFEGSDIAATVPALGEGIGVGNGIVLEALATFILVWTVFAVLVDRDGAFFKVAGMPIGFAVTAGIFAIGSATGGALNPVRWLGPALIAGEWSDALVWLVGPIAGGILAGALYLFAIKPRRADAFAAERP